MVNTRETFAGDPAVTLALIYAPLHARAGLTALFALDARLGAILRTTREPIVGQMRLAWWRDALRALDTMPPPAEPILAMIARDVLPHGITGAGLSGMIDGWEALLAGDPPDDVMIAAFGAGRGGGLFETAAMLTGAAASDPVASAGAGWAIADLARNASTPALRSRAVALAQSRLEAATAVRWSAAGRALGALAHDAAAGLAGARFGPKRAARMLWHRITGR